MGGYTPPHIDGSLPAFSNEPIDRFTDYIQPQLGFGIPEHYHFMSHSHSLPGLTKSEANRSIQPNYFPEFVKFRGPYFQHRGQRLPGVEEVLRDAAPAGSGFNDFSIRSRNEAQALPSFAALERAGLPSSTWRSNSQSWTASSGTGGLGRTLDENLSRTGEVSEFAEVQRDIPPAHSYLNIGRYSNFSDGQVLPPFSNLQSAGPSTLEFNDLRIPAPQYNGQYRLGCSEVQRGISRGRDVVSPDISTYSDRSGGQSHLHTTPKPQNTIPSVPGYNDMRASACSHSGSQFIPTFADFLRGVNSTTGRLSDNIPPSPRMEEAPVQHGYPPPRQLRPWGI